MAPPPAAGIPSCEGTKPVMLHRFKAAGGRHTRSGGAELGGGQLPGCEGTEPRSGGTGSLSEARGELGNRRMRADIKQLLFLLVSGGADESLLRFPSATCLVILLIRGTPYDLT